MNLTFYFDENGAGNPYFKYIYNSIFDRFKLEYPEHEIKHQQPDYPNLGNCPGCPGGISHLQIINEKNNKTILMSFWDRGMDVFLNGLGWEKYNIVQYIGGLGMNLTSEQIKEKYGINHIKFQYPLGVRDSYEFIDELRESYDPEKKIRKAIFIGAIYATRTEFNSFMKNHPLIEIIGNDQGYHGKAYFEKMNQYRMAISFNGNGELCLRDSEIMGLNLPLIRAELNTQLYNRLIPDYHYFKTTEPCSDAHLTYRNMDPKYVADKFVQVVEENIDNYSKLKEIADNGFKYFDMYSRPDYILDLFFKLINVNELNS